MKSILILVILFLGWLVVEGDVFGACPRGYIHQGDIGCVKAVRGRPRPPVKKPSDALRNQAQRKYQEAQQKLNQAQSITAQINKINQELQITKTELQQKQNELNQTTQQINQTANHLTRIENEAANVTVSGVSGQLGGLGQLASNIDNVVQNLQQSGHKREDIDKAIRDFGIDPGQLSNHIREISAAVRPANTMGGLINIQALLNRSFREVEGSEAQFRNQVVGERNAVAKAEADIAKARSELNNYDQSRQDHDRKADSFDAECRKNWLTCILNTPKAAWERSMAALDQAQMERVKAWVGLVEFTKIFPQIRIMVNDAFATPLVAIKNNLKGQIQEIENSKQQLNQMIASKNQEFQRLSQEKNSFLQKQSQLSQTINNLNGESYSHQTKVANLDIQKKQLELEAGRAREEAAHLEAQANAAGPQRGGTIRSASAEMRPASPASPSVSSKELAQKEKALKEAQKKMAEIKPLPKLETPLARGGQFNKVAEKPKILPMPAVDPGLKKRWAKEEAQHQSQWNQMRRKDEALLTKKEAPLKKELSEKDQAVEEAKRKVKEAEEQMSAALEKKKQEEIASRKPLIVPPPEEDHGLETTNEGPTAGEEVAVQHCERGIWSPTLQRCVEEEVEEVAAPPDCEAGTHWSPTLKSCQAD